MSKRIKVDLHTHTSEGPTEKISYNAFQLIDKASEDGFDVLAITNHGTITYNRKLADYASQKGILLIPGMEAEFSGRHVLVLNPGFKKVPSGLSLEDLAKFRSPASLIIAPHPFFPSSASLRSELYSYLSVFDAIEFSHYYNHLVNSNKKAVRVAHEARLPMIGNSDCHMLWQLGTTYSLVEAEKNIHSVLDAVKRGRVEIRTAPLSLLSMGRVALRLIWMRRTYPFLSKT